MQLNGSIQPVINTASTLNTGVQLASKVLPALTPIASALGPVGTALSVLSFAGGLFGGHVIRMKFYADAQITENNVSLIRAWGNSDAKGTNQSAAPVVQIGEAIRQLAIQFNCKINPFTLGVKYMDKYRTFGFIIGTPITKTNRLFNVDATNQSAVQNAICYLFALAIKRGYITTDNLELIKAINTPVLSPENGMVVLNRFASDIQANQIAVQTANNSQPNSNVHSGSRNYYGGGSLPYNPMNQSINDFPPLPDTTGLNGLSDSFNPLLMLGLIYLVSQS